MSTLENVLGAYRLASANLTLHLEASKPEAAPKPSCGFVAPFAPEINKVLGDVFGAFASLGLLMFVIFGGLALFGSDRSRPSNAKRAFLGLAAVILFGSAAYLFGFAHEVGGKTCIG